MNNFGMGVKLGVDLPSEDKGFVADVDFYNKLYQGRWNSCTNVFLGIGQGELSATPLQMANLMCIIGNKGFYYTPHFVEKIDGENPNDTTLTNFKTQKRVNNLSPEMYEVVKLGMQDVVNYGTAMVARIPGIEVCGKTGTAENFGFVNGKREKFDDHSWFVCFAPKENPVIAVAVIIENGGFGATWGGPIARMIMEKYINDSLSTSSKLDSARIAAKEIILPFVKRKRMLLDSLRRSRKMNDPSPIIDNNTNSAIPKPNNISDSIKQKKKIVPKPIEIPNPEKPLIKKDSILNADNKKIVFYNNKLIFLYA
jgi:penicillin-binding protein 2